MKKSDAEKAKKKSAGSASVPVPKKATRATKGEKLAERIYRHHIKIVRRLNDTHVFIQAALPGLQELHERVNTSGDRKDRKWYMPKFGRSRTFARRMDHEVAQIVERFLGHELHENLIITAVSQFEAFLVDVLAEVLQAYPKKLGIRLEGASKDVSLDAILDSGSYEEVIASIIENRCRVLLYASPRNYLAYLADVIGIDVDGDAYKHFIEIKAARDLVVHNSSVINSIYLEKAGPLARGKLRGRLAIDRDYFDHVIAVLKKLAGSISRDVEKAYGRPNDNSAAAIQT